MRAHRLVVIGASAGGIEALRTLASGLPEDFAAPICVVVHTAPHSPALLPEILNRSGELPATNAVDRERPRPGRIYVAPPDFHLVVEPDLLRATRGPRENRFRPAIDPLFRSAAHVYGPGAIGVILSGNLDDGTDGLAAIKSLGGTAIAQDPSDAMFPAMPQSAIDHVAVDYIVPLVDIAPLLARLVEAPPLAEERDVPDRLKIELKIAMEEDPIAAGLEQIGTPSRFACPECHSVLLEVAEGSRIKFRCHTGHAYTLASLVAAIDDGIEDALWIALRALEEGELLITRMAEHVRSHDAAGTATLTARALEVRKHADIVRRLVGQRAPVPVGQR